jgi:hypothetical protein
MRIRLILALLILVFACALQSWFASIGMFMDFMFATLIVFAFFFDIWELVIFILFAVFVINWQPAISITIVLFAVIPLIVFAFHKFFSLIPWAAAPVAIIIGFFLLYVGVAPGIFFAQWQAFLTDLAGGLIFGELVFFVLNRSTQ